MEVVGQKCNHCKYMQCKVSSTIWSPQLDSENCIPVQVLEKKNDAYEETINLCDPCSTTGSFKT